MSMDWTEMDFIPEDSFPPLEVDEEKFKVKVDPCLICALPAVSYDWQGNVIKRESLDGQEQSKRWSKEQLFECLCKSFGLGKNARKTGVNPWRIQLDPLPFCKDCETLTLSLAEVYSKLDELKTELKIKIEKGEEDFQKDNLYEKHDKSYLEFRQDALLGRETSKLGRISSATCPSRHCISKSTRLRKARRKGNQVQLKNQSRVKILQRSRRKTEVKSEEQPPTASQCQVLNETECATEFQEEIKEDLDVDSPARKLRKRKSASKPPYQEESSSNDSDSISLLKATKPKRGRKRRTSPKHRGRSKYTAHGSEIISNCKDTAPVVVGTNRRVELQRCTSTGKKGQGYLERDPVTGNISYTTGFGNRFGSNRTTLIFNHLEAPHGKMVFECSTCQKTIPVLTCTRKQQSLFREHYLISHTNRYRCRLCASVHSVNYSNREQLVQHLSSHHGIQTMEKYYNAYKQSNPIQSTKGGSTSKSVIKLLKPCSICGMPGADLRSSEFRNHLFSHMNEEEKVEALSLEGRRYKELVAPSQQQLENGTINQCQTCGKFITNGALGLSRHQLEAHPEQGGPPNIGAPPAMCNICAVVLSSKKSLETHTNKLHPDGKWDGPFKCKFPGCSHNSSGDPSLKTHVEEEHGKSKEATSGVLCRVCGKVLASSWCLKQHGLVHSKAKPWKCHICPNMFPLKNSLELHLVTKHGIGAEVFKCEVEGCGKLFPVKRYHRLHMRTVHGVYTKKRKSQQVEDREAPE